MGYKVILSRRAFEDLQKLIQSGLGRQAKEITEILMKNPYQTLPRFVRLVSDMNNYFSRCINIQHRYIYQILPNDGKLQGDDGVIYDGIIHVLRMWTHYE